jgi:endonuclease/exonuclease/phosphatase (EEP) superfamily protein YafD
MTQYASIYRVKLRLSFERGLFMSIDRSVMEESASLKPLRSRFSRWTGILLWCGALAIGLWMAEAYLLPQRLRITRPLYGLLASASFVARVLRFDSGLALAAIALLAVLLRRRWLIGFSGILSVILLWPTFISLLPKSPPAAQGPTVRLMTMNMIATNRAGDCILYQIRKANPDVIAFQEYSNWADDLLQHELADYSYRLMEPKPDATGTALYSKIPFTGQIVHPHNILGTRIYIRAQLQIAGQDVALYAIHPSSPHRYTNILRNRLQTADMLDELKNEKLPVIIAGDFNATEVTANLEAYESAGLESAYDLAGVGRGSTWPEVTLLKYLPRFRIDHILIGPQFTCTSARVCGPTGSDHRPVIADVGFKRLL